MAKKILLKLLPFFEASQVSRSLAVRFTILRCGTVVHQITQILPILTSRSHRLKLYNIYKKKLNPISCKYEGKKQVEKKLSTGFQNE